MSPWQVLNIPTNSSPDIIKAAYRKLARLHHPDLGGDVATMQAINNAYDVLTGGVEVRYTSKPLSYMMQVIECLITIQIDSGYKRGWVAYSFSEVSNRLNTTLEDWEYLAQRLGYKRNWAEIKFNHQKQKK